MGAFEIVPQVDEVFVQKQNKKDDIFCVIYLQRQDSDGKEALFGRQTKLEVLQVIYFC